MDDVVRNKIIEYAKKMDCSKARTVSIENRALTIGFDHNITLKNAITSTNILFQAIYNDRLVQSNLSGVTLENYEDIINESLNLMNLFPYKYEYFKNFISNNSDKTKFHHKVEFPSIEIEVNNLFDWIYKEKSDVEKEFNCNLPFFLLQKSNIYLEIFDSCYHTYTSNIKESLLSLIAYSQEKNKLLPAFAHKRNLSEFTNLVDLLKTINFSNKLNRTLKPEIEVLRGNIKFSYEASHDIITFFINLFNSDFILNKRSVFDSDILNKKIFKDTINLNDIPALEYDCEGVKCKEKGLISRGVITDLLNDSKTQGVIGGSPGNSFIRPFDNSVGIKHSNIKLYFNEEIYTKFDIFIEQIDLQKSVFDLSTGFISFISYGYENDDINNYKTYSCSINILDLINSSRPASNAIWVDDIFTSELAINIEN